MTPAQVRRASPQPCPVDRAIAHVNAVLKDPLRRNAARCSPEVGRFYQITQPGTFSPDEVLQIQQRCLTAGWQGNVVFYRGSLSITLDEYDTRTSGAFYNGKPLAPAV